MIASYAKVEVTTLFPSKTGHVEPCLNLGGPSSKAKYYSVTDSESVPRGKGEKNPGEGSEIEPETIHLQAVGAQVTACLLHELAS